MVSQCPLFKWQAHSSSLPILKPSAPPSSTTAHPSLTTASESHQKCTQKQQYAKDAHAHRWAETRAQHPLELHGLNSVTLKHKQGLEGLRSAVELEHFNTASS